jgi:hypothetical protein
MSNVPKVTDYSPHSIFVWKFEYWKIVWDFDIVIWNLKRYI